MKDSDNKPPAKPAGKSAPSKVFDVSRPGKAMAAPSSRPILVGNKPEAEDAQTAVSGIGETRPQLLTKRKIEVSPVGEESETETEKAASKVKLSQPAETTEDKPAEGPTKDSQEAAAPTALPPVAKPEEEPKTEATPSTEEVEAIAAAALSEIAEPPKDTTAPDAPQPEPVETPAQPDAQTEEKAVSGAEPETPATETSQGDAPPDLAAKTPPAKEEVAPKDEAVAPTEAAAADQPVAGSAEAEATPEADEPKIEPLFNESGDIIVSHHNYRKHSAGKTMLLLVLILLLAVIVADLLLDLGILTLEAVPHTDFFAN